MIVLIQPYFVTFTRTPGQYEHLNPEAHLDEDRRVYINPAHIVSMETSTTGDNTVIETVAADAITVKESLDEVIATLAAVTETRWRAASASD